MAEIPLDENIVANNKLYEASGPLPDDRVAETLGRLLGIPFSRTSRGSVQEKHNYTVLYRIAESLPDEYKWGRIEGQQILNNALDKIDLRPYITMASEDAPEDEQDNFQTISAAAEQYFTVTLPTVEAENAAAAGPQPSSSGDFLVDPELTLGMSAQEFAQTYRDTTLLDLGFDKSLKFGLAGIVAGGDAGGDDGIDIYEASRWLYSLEPEQVGQLQQKLAQAGYFDALGQSYSQVNDSDDPATRMAWDMFLVDVVRSGASANPQEFLNQQIEGYLANRAPAEGFVFNDEATLQSMGNEFARALVGRNLDYSELQSFYKTVRAWERQAALGVTFAQENEQIDVRARAEEYFDRELRVEQGKQIAFDWISKFE